MAEDAKLSIPKLNSTNWAMWKIRMECLLCRDDLWSVVEENPPAEEARNAKWKANDRKARSNIMLLLDDAHLNMVKKCKLAYDVFTTLKDHHEKSSRSVRVSLLKRICSTNLSEGGDAEKHLVLIDDLLERLDAAGTVLDDDTKICLLMRSLPPSYDGLVTALDNLAANDVTIDVVKAKIVDEYLRRVERESASVKSDRALRSAEYKPGSGSSGAKETRICHHCKKPGHLRRNCRLLKKEEENANKHEKKEKVKAKTAQSDNRGIAFVVSGEQYQSWVIDLGGASTHMTNNR